MSYLPFKYMNSSFKDTPQPLHIPYPNNLNTSSEDSYPKLPAHLIWLISAWHQFQTSTLAITVRGIAFATLLSPSGYRPNPAVYPRLLSFAPVGG